MAAPLMRQGATREDLPHQGGIAMPTVDRGKSEAVHYLKLQLEVVFF
jgi:hypothetical protein